MRTSPSILQAEVKDMLRDRLQKQANDAFDEYKKEAVEKFEKQIEDKRDELIANIVIRVSRHFDISRAGDMVTIQIRKEL